MIAVVGVIWSLVAAAGAALAVSAPFGAAGNSGQYLAGHVLLGLGLGQLLAATVRLAVRRVVRKAIPRTTPAYLAAVPAAEAAAAVPAAEAAAAVRNAPAADAPAVTYLYPRPAAVVPLRGRHAA